MIASRFALASMAVGECRTELAELFARGYRRLLVARKCSQNCLAELPQSEAPCDAMVNATENQPETEVVT